MDSIPLENIPFYTHELKVKDKNTETNCITNTYLLHGELKSVRVMKNYRGNFTERTEKYV